VSRIGEGWAPGLEIPDLHVEQPDAGTTSSPTFSRSSMDAERRTNQV
jgi:hypothetical protein